MAVSLALAIVALARAFLINARAIRRDVNERFDDLQTRLEAAGNSVVDRLLDQHRTNR
jgi:hypothetical protein